MKMYRPLGRVSTLLTLILAASPAVLKAQTFAASGTTTLSVSVSAEAALSVSTSTTSLTASGAIFSPFTGTTNLTYKVRTTKVGGSGTITTQVTTDFTGAGPSVATPPSSGDALTYTCTVASPGTACSSAQTASTTAATSVGTFGANAHSAKAGNTASLAWSLTNDPLYETGTYTATVTFTISAL